MDARWRRVVVVAVSLDLELSIEQDSERLPSRGGRSTPVCESDAVAASPPSPDADEPTALWRFYHLGSFVAFAAVRLAVKLCLSLAECARP